MGVKERKVREKKARRRAILEAAKTVFFEKGFTATTMDQIAEVAEVSKGSLYLHFPSKEELYASLLLEGLELLYDRFSRAVRDAEGWEDKLRRIGRAYYQFYLDHNPYFKILFLLRHGELAPKVSEDLYQMCNEKGQACLGPLSLAIEEGIREGEVRGEDAMDLATFMWGSFNGIFLIYEEEEHRVLLHSPLDRIVEIGIDFFVRGLKKGG
jgi:TetR/AcrR family transcriptional regulator